MGGGRSETHKAYLLLATAKNPVPPWTRCRAMRNPLAIPSFSLHAIIGMNGTKEIAFDMRVCGIVGRVLCALKTWNFGQSFVGGYWAKESNLNCALRPSRREL